MSDKRPRRWGYVRASSVALAAALLCITAIAAPRSTESARANGDTRTIYLHHAHTHESIAATYLVDGQYDSAVLDKLNWFLRDWRRDESTHMDPRLFDVIWTVYRESGSAQPIEVMSAYRSPETNAMLRRRSRGVAEHSQHILGKAMDQHYVDVPMSRIRDIAMRLQRGGVGFYPTAGTPFVHMDVGGVRHWPRMSYDQLSRLFPDGKTVHIPSNGQPLPGYEEARAELEARGDSFNYPTAAEVKSKGFFAWLFGGGDDEDDSEAASARGGGRAPAGRQRVASLDPGSTGSLPSAAATGLQGKDAGMRSFFASSSSPSPSSPYGTPPGRRVPPSPDPDAQRRLAAAMASEEAQRQAAAQQEAQRQAAQQAAAQQAAAEQQASAQQAAAAAQQATEPLGQTGSAAPAIVEAAMAPAAVPMPPRRPLEFASDGPTAPLPVARPVEFASLAPHKSAPPDAIAALIGGTLPSRTPGLPSAIVLGNGKPAAPAAVMAYASPEAPPSSAAVKAAVPLPVARPSFVAARLDRSNFRSLTGSGSTSRAGARSGLGSAVAALRPAAQANIGMLAGKASSGAAAGFGREAVDLPIDHFGGSRGAKAADGTD